MAAILVVLGTGALYFIFIVQNYYLVDRSLDRMKTYTENVVESMADGLVSVDRGGKIVTLNLRMYIGADDPHDAIRIVGSPDLNLRIEGGVAGDQATAAILVNSIPAVIAAQPGLATVMDLPSPCCMQP